MRCCYVTILYIFDTAKVGKFNEIQRHTDIEIHVDYRPLKIVETAIGFKQPDKNML